ncbi:hypothetical protein [Streptomyces regalis]|uniref:hypothetical protein n=1 Tax=Streptomyces regalis TaxID=68262 RepID=UPI0007C6D9E2|nr:hypothetical protein [Streptomyces regalis]
MLPTLAASWIAHQRSVNTQRAYARGIKIFEEFAREHGAHPMALKFVLADTFRLYLESTPTWVRVKGGRRGEMVRAGKGSVSVRWGLAQVPGGSQLHNVMYEGSRHGRATAA